MRNSHTLVAVAVGWNGYLQDRPSGRSRSRNDGQNRSRQWDSRWSISTTGGWTRDPAGPEATINSRRRSASGSGCSSVRPPRDADRRRQGSRRRMVARTQSGGRGRICDRGAVGSLRSDYRGKSILGDSRRGSGGVCRVRAALRGNGKNRSRIGVGRQRSTVVTTADTRATNRPEGAENTSITSRGLCAHKSPKSEEARRSPPKTALSRRGTSSPISTPGTGEEQARSPQARMRENTPILHEGETATCTAVVVCGRLWQTVQKIVFFRWKCLCDTPVCSRTG